MATASGGVDDGGAGPGLRMAKKTRRSARKKKTSDQRAAARGRLAVGVSRCSPWVYDTRLSAAQPRGARATTSRWALCDVRWKFSVYRRFARGVSRVRARCTVPRVQVRPLASNNEDLKQSKQFMGLEQRGLRPLASRG
eukprot:scaffold4897_cov58-Phaeocystis_antarctica.AAC.1